MANHQTGLAEHDNDQDRDRRLTQQRDADNSQEASVSASLAILPCMRYVRKYPCKPAGRHILSPNTPIAIYTVSFSGDPPFVLDAMHVRQVILRFYFEGCLRTELSKIGSASVNQESEFL